MMEIEHSYVQNQSLNGGFSSDIDDDVIDCELIDLYCEHKYLYDKSHPGFKDLGLKENAWIKISNKMMAFGKLYTPEYCSKRCTSLRDQFSREKRAREGHGDGLVKRNFPLYDKLSFLKPYIKRRNVFNRTKRKQDNINEESNTSENLSKDENTFESEDSSLMESNPIIQKQEIILVPEGQEEAILHQQNGDFLLIKLYRERKYLYDRSHKEFRSLAAKENGWKEISQIMSSKVDPVYTTDYCIKRCTSLRDQYSRLKRLSRNQTHENNGTGKSKWALTDELRFLDQFIKKRRTVRKKELQPSIKLHPKWVFQVENFKNEENMKHQLSQCGLVYNRVNNETEVIIPNNISDISNDSICNAEEITFENAEIETLEIQEEDQQEGQQTIKPIRLEDNNDNNEVQMYLDSLKNNILSFLKGIDKNPSTPEQAFGQFIALRLQNMNKEEKDIKERKLLEVLLSPVELLN